MKTKRFLPIILSLAMLFTAYPVNMAWADEVDDFKYDENEDNQSDWDGYDWGQSDRGFANVTRDSGKEDEPEEPEQPEEDQDPEFIDPVLPPDMNWLKISSDKLSFGQVMQGDLAVDYQYFNIANDGSKTHDYSYNLVDPDDIWEIDDPDKTSIDPGEKLQFSVHPDTTKPAGKYNGSITVFGTNEYGNMESVSISLSVAIYSKDPWVNFVDVTPKNLVLTPGAVTKLNATVECGDGASSEVEWSVSGGEADTRIDQDGTLHVSEREKNDTLTVKATSKQDSSKSGAVAVGIKKNSYSITTESSPSDGGVSAGDGTFSMGDNVTVNANPNNKYTFEGWYENGNKVADSQKYTFTVEGNRNLVAKFSQEKVRVEVRRNNKNGGSVSDSKTLNYGDSITLKAKAKDGYEFDGWYEGSDKLSDKAEFKLKNVTRDYVVTAAFAKREYKVTLTASPNEGGTLKGAGTYKKGDTARLEAGANKGYKFMGWSNDSQNWGSNPKISIENIRQDYSVMAIFEPEKPIEKNIKVSSSASAGGTISPSGTYELPPNVNISFSITPKNGYAIADVTVDGKSIGAVNSFSLTNITTDHSVIANFKKQDVNANTVNEHLNSDFKDNKHVESGEEKESDKASSKNDEYKEDEELVYFKGALQMLNYTENEARQAIEDGDDRELMEAALYNGDLMVCARNEYADNPLETAEESYYEISSVPNIEDVIDSMLDADTKLALFFGMPVM